MIPYLPGGGLASLTSSISSTQDDVDRNELVAFDKVRHIIIHMVGQADQANCYGHLKKP